MVWKHIMKASMIVFIYSPCMLQFPLTSTECYLMFTHRSFLILKYNISRRIMSIIFSSLLINISFGLLLAQGLPFFILLNFNSYETFVKQSLENQEEEAKTSIMENRENQKRINKQNKNQIKPHLMIFQWAQTSGKNHKQIHSKSAANNSKCLIVNLIKSLTKFQVKPRKKRRKKQQQRCMNDP